MQTPNEDNSPDDFVAELRAKAVEKLHSDDDQCADRNQIIGKIRALLVTNKEILDRCMEAKIESGNLDVPVKFGSPDWSAPFGFTCKRTNYSVVRVNTVGHNAEFVALSVR